MEQKEKKILLIITGAKGSGKSTFVSNVSKELLNDTITKGVWMISRPFAWPLKELINDAIMAFDEKAYKFIDNNKEVIRPVYQAIGSFFREMEKDYWVNYTLNKIEAYDLVGSRSGIICIDDARYLNEFALSKSFALKHGIEFIHVKIDRPSNIPGQDNHPSENEWKSYQDYDLVVNDENYSSAIKSIVDKFK